MKTRDVLQQMTGRSWDYGDGPLGSVGRQLLAKFQAREANRLADADERAAMAGKGPILDALRRRLAEARSAELFNDATPCVTRFEAAQALKRARSANPTDRGVRMASAHAERLWHKDTMGVLTLGDVARLRAHYAEQYPRSVVAQVIDVEIPKVGFNTLPVAKLAQMAAQVSGRTDAERQHAYEQVVHANGLTTNKPEHVRARAFIRELADMAAEPAPQQERHAGGHAAADRALSRMAAHDDPILSRMGQMGPPMDAGPDMGADLPPMEEEVPHEEETEVIEEVESPISGEPLALELGAAEPEPEMGAAPEAPTAGPEELTPAVMASLQHFGQLDDYASDDEGMIEDAMGGDEGIDMLDETPDETSIMMEDPTAPGEMLEVTLTPAENEDDPDMGMGVSAPLPGMDNMASRQAGRVFSVFIVRGGVKHSEPLERVRAPGMPAMIRRIGRKLREAEGQGYVQRPVLANQQTFQQQAYVVLDEQLGNYLLITAQEHGNEFTPDIVTEGQPVVQHNLQIDEGDGADVLLEDAELSQNVPSALGEEGEGEHKEGGKKSLSEVQVKRVCAKLGLSASKIESKILDGEEVRVGTAALQLNDNGDVVFYRGKRGRVASLMDLDVVIKDFMALAAAQAVKGRQASKKGGTYQIRPLFTVGCGNCRYLGEYLMPDKPENVRCASCGWVTPSEAVAIQLETRQASAFPGYVITTSIPGPKKNRKLNAKRMLKAIKQVVPTDGAKIRSGSLEVVARGVGDAELNRVRRVLEDVFGARDIVAQQAPAVNMMGQPTQHAQMPMAPQPQQPAQPMGPSVQPVQPVQPGAGMQQATMEQYADPTDGVPAVQPAQIQAQRLPVGPGIKHVLVQYEDGRQLWQPVEAANEQMARAIIGSYMDGTQVVQVVDSQLRAAQLAGPPMGDLMEEAPAEQMGLEMTGPGGGENIETASLDQQTEETIKAAMLHYRNTGVGIAEATDSFVNNYSKFLDRYGDKTSPARHLIEAAVIRIAKEIYEKPALVQQPPQFTARLRAELEQARQKHNWHVREARRLQAEEAKGPSPKKINEQQDDWVNLPGGGEMLGPDSETQEGYSDPKVNTQVDTISKQPGSQGADTSTEPGTDSRDPGDFDAGKGYDADGHVTFDGPGWGQSWPDTDMGSDSQTGDNETTSSMDGVADGAYSNVRSK